MGFQNMSHHQNLSNFYLLQPVQLENGKKIEKVSQEQISSIQSSIEENLNRFKYS